MQALSYRILNLEFLYLFRHLVKDLPFHRHTSPVVLKRRMLTYRGGGFIHIERLFIFTGWWWARNRDSDYFIFKIITGKSKFLTNGRCPYFRAAVV